MGHAVLARELKAIGYASEETAYGETVAANALELEKDGGLAGVEKVERMEPVSADRYEDLGEIEKTVAQKPDGNIHWVDEACIAWAGRRGR